MRVLLSSHTYITHQNQRKLDALASLHDIDLRVVVPQWIEGSLHGIIPVERPSCPAYSFVPLPTHLTRRGGNYVHRSLDLTIRTFRPDIVHVESGARGLTTFQVAVYRRLWASRARFGFFTWENVNRTLPPPLTAFMRYNLSQSDYAICGNHDAVDLLRVQGYCGPASVIPQLGVDMDVFQPRDGSALRRQLGLHTDAFVVGFGARFVPEKGTHLVLQAVARLEGKWQLLLMGTGPEKDQLLQLANALGISDRIRWVDTVPHLEVARYLNAMDVCLSASISTPGWKEQFGLMLAQAMSSGIAVIGSTCGETPNVMGDAGLAFPEGNVGALTAALRQVQQSPALRAELGQRGVARIRQCYTFTRIAEQTARVWRDALQSDTGTRRLPPVVP